MDCFVLMLKIEVSLVLIFEVLLICVLVVFINVGLVYELVVDGVIGFLVVSGDVEGLVNGVLKIFKDDKFCVEMGEFGCECVVFKVLLELMVWGYEDLVEVIYFGKLLWC